MSRIHLTTYGTTLPPIPVDQPSGRKLLLPKLQFRCWVRLPDTRSPRDGIIDTGSPFSWFPEDVWSRFRPGTDFEWLPFSPGYHPPQARTAGWTFRFRVARLLAPITLIDTSTEVERNDVIVQFTDGNPPRQAGSHRLPVVVLGLWGGVLEGTRLAINSDPQSGGLDGSLEF